MGFTTDLIHGSHERQPFGAVSVPVYRSDTFELEELEDGEKIFSGQPPGTSTAA